MTISPSIKIARIVLLWSIVCVWMLPFIGILIASLTPYENLLDGWWHFSALDFHISNYLSTLFTTSVPLLRPLLNSFYMAIMSALIPVSLALCAGYALARYRIFFRRGLLILILMLLAIPLQLISVPLYRMLDSLSLTDTFFSVILINAATALPWITFFMLNFIRKLPFEIEESAFIDGAGDFRIFGSIIFPQCIAALASTFVIQFVFAWTDFFLPLVFIYSPEKYLAIQVIPMLRGQFLANWGELAAASVVVIIVPLLVFLFFQRSYVRGMVGWIPDK